MNKGVYIFVLSYFFRDFKHNMLVFSQICMMTDINNVTATQGAATAIRVAVATIATVVVVAADTTVATIMVAAVAAMDPVVVVVEVDVVEGTNHTRPISSGKFRISTFVGCAVFIWGVPCLTVVIRV